MDTKDISTTYREAIDRVSSKTPTPTTPTETMRFNDLVDEEASRMLLELLEKGETSNTP